jgi:hypothetical protein
VMMELVRVRGEEGDTRVFWSKNQILLFSPVGDFRKIISQFVTDGLEMRPESGKMETKKLKITGLITDP